MPLILFTGYPCSGKSRYAQELISLLQDKLNSAPELQKRQYNIIYHNDESMGIKHSDYSTSQDERKLRSEIMSVVKRDLSQTNIVIVDSLNYIKGSRYQLHCEVKNSTTTFCLVQVMCSVEQAHEWNKTAENPWDPELLNQLVQRYEEPNAQNRWDSPLFPVFSPHDSLKDLSGDLFSAIFSTNKSLNTRDPLSRAFQKPNSVTILKPASQSNFIQLVEMETSKVVKKLLDEIKIAQSIGSRYPSRVIVSENVTDINDSNCSYVDLPVSGVTLPQLQRLKRQFINLNKLRDMEKERVVHLFADYLNKNLNE